MDKRRWRRTVTTTGLILVVAGVAAAQQAAQRPGGRNVFEMKFTNIKGVPTCATASVQNGDPATTPFILLAQVKAGCTIPWHWHTANESLMIVSGTPRVTMKEDGKPVMLQPGGFAQLPSKHIHEFHCDRDCSFYLYSDAKFDIHYVDPSGKEISPEDALKPFKEVVATAMR